MSKNPNEVRGSEPDADGAAVQPEADREWRDHEHVAEPGRGRAAQKNEERSPGKADEQALERAVREEGGDHPPGKKA